jgi:hypothetical protein
VTRLHHLRVKPRLNGCTIKQTKTHLRFEFIVQMNNAIVHLNNEASFMKILFQPNVLKN